MNFNSAIFLLFLAAFFAGWKLLERHLSLRWAYLTLASFVFYGWWNWRFLALLVGTGSLDYWLGRAFEFVHTRRRRRLLLMLSLASNLGVLLAFKYSGFLAKHLELLLQLSGRDVGLVSRVPAPLLVLPIGISFYTFESLSYIIDVYRGRVRPAKSYFQFFAFLSMFPRLIAGPIERAANLLPQLASPRPLTSELRWSGLMLIVQGYCKKTVIADNLAPVIGAAFAASAPQSTAQWWLIMMSFAVQIYCDFSGYSDIARGLANWMGYDFRLNFDHPYRSIGFSEFWKRWHISLSTWFRDYLYIPLGGGRRGRLRTHGNLWITMLVAGFWHGAQWTFVGWGGLHALLLSVERLTGWPERLRHSLTGRAAGIVGTFLLATTSWVFFRAASFRQAAAILGRMYWPSEGATTFAGVPAVLLWAVVVHELWSFLRSESILDGLPLDPAHPARRAWLALLLVAAVFARGPGTSFIYFQF